MYRQSSVDIPMSEGPVNLNWGPIMKHINESPFEFFQGGGWDFLGTSADDVCYPPAILGLSTHSIAG